MISGLLNLIYGLIQSIIDIFPTGSTFPTEVHTAFSTLGSYVGLMDVFVPVSTMLWCLTLLFGIEIAIFGFKTLKWVISFIPMIGGKGNT